MTSTIDQLAALVCRRLRQLRGAFRGRAPSLATVKSILTVAFFTSLRTEEARFLRTSITFADPRSPQVLPMIIRHDYPLFTRFDRRYVFDVATLTKLARSVDQW